MAVSGASAYPGATSTTVGGEPPTATSTTLATTKGSSGGSGVTPGELSKSSGDSSTGASWRDPTLYRGKEGKPIQVASNYLSLTVDKGKGLFEYEVRFDPPVDAREQRYRLINSLKHVTGPAKSYDGAKLMLPTKLDGPDSQTVAATDGAGGQPVNVTLSFKRKREHGDRDYITHVNVLFNRVLRALKLTRHNRNYYDPKATHKIPQYHLQVWATINIFKRNCHEY